MHWKVGGATQIHTTNNLPASGAVLPSDLIEQELVLVSSSTVETGLD